MTKQPIKFQTDRKSKKKTNSQNERQLFDEVFTQQLNKTYFTGLRNGSHMQCSTILELYKTDVDKMPDVEKTKESLSVVLDKIFSFCEKGLSTEIDFEKLSTLQVKGGE